MSSLLGGPRSIWLLSFLVFLPLWKTELELAFYYFYYYYFCFCFVRGFSLKLVICPDAATKGVFLGPGWDAILSPELNRIEYRTTQSEADLHFSRTKIQKGKTRISVNYDYKTYSFSWYFIYFPTDYPETFCKWWKNFISEEFQKEIWS